MSCKNCDEYLNKIPCSCMVNKSNHELDFVEETMQEYLIRIGAINNPVKTEEFKRFDRDD